MRYILLSGALLTLAFGVNAQESETRDPPAETERSAETEATRYDATVQQTEQQEGERMTRTSSQAAESRQGDTLSQDAQDQQPQMQQAQQTQQAQQQSMQQQSQSMAGSQGQQGASAQTEVARAQFTTEVQNKEPVDEVSTFPAEQDPLYFFTEVKNAAGQTITHRWKHNGEVMAEVPLQVGSDSWRTWSSKELIPSWEGEWTVEVVDANGQVIEQQTITVEAPEQTRNVGYSPDEQGAQQQSGQSANQATGQQSQSGQQQGMTSTSATQQSTSTTQQTQDTGTTSMQTSEGDQLKLDEGWETEDVSAEEVNAEEEDAADEPPTEEDY